MTTTGRLQQRYDHRLRDLVHGTGDMTLATDLGVPRSTARGWLGKAPKVVVSLDVTDLKESELRQEVLELRRRVTKLTGTTSARPRPAAKLGILTGARGSARRTRQDQDPASRGSCPCVCSVAGRPAVPAIVPESIPCLATPPARVCPRRSVVLSTHVAPSTDPTRGLGDQGHGDRARIPACPEPGHSPSWRSDSVRSGRPPRPGTTRTRARKSRMSAEIAPRAARAR